MPHKIKFVSIVLAAIVGLLVLSACGTPLAGGGDQSPSKTVAVTGNGVAFGTPDIAVASVGVQTRNENPGAAVSENTDKMQAIIAALKELGIDEKDIQTANFSVYAQQNYDTNGQPTNITYVADNTVTITVRDLNKVGDALGKAVAAGANNIYGVSFSVSDQSKLEAEARDKAMADAKARAEQLAKAAGVTLGGPMSISEYTSAPPVIYAADVKGLAAGVGGGAPVPVSTGQIQVNLQVSVTYEIK
ncbi:MAG: SIMPL domain-containing protein [Chloroflexi bacterium]|nr:SIMPL domain-containing protein [Chloroflexota bacterium]